MAKQRGIKALIDRYYGTLDEFQKQYAIHEGAVSVAFQTLLARVSMEAVQIVKSLPKEFA